jgi:DnaJ-class molecular chaperone
MELVEKKVHCPKCNGTGKIKVAMEDGQMCQKCNKRKAVDEYEEKSYQTKKYIFVCKKCYLDHVQKG